MSKGCTPRLAAWSMAMALSLFAASARAATPANSGDGTMIVTPATNTSPGSATNVFKFSFRADAIGTWSSGAQVKLTIPAAWTPPQTNAAGSPGYLRTILTGTYVLIDSITGTGPWDVLINYYGANGITKGFDLIYTNVTVPAEGAYPFTTASKQSGSAFTNLVSSPVITVITRQTQAITFTTPAYTLSQSGLTLEAAASSGLPLTFTVASGPATLPAGSSTLTFSATGTVKVVAAQAGTIAWYPAASITNTFSVLAGGSMTVTPTLAAAACATNVVKFKFRGDGIGAWLATGSLVRITIPETWPQPQTNSASTPGYVKAVVVAGTSASIQSIIGTGPWDINVNYLGNNSDTRGFDLTYTNLLTPSTPGVSLFKTACQQRGIVYTNSALDTTIELIEDATQTLAFDPLPNQLTSNKVLLAATASSGLPAAYSVTSGPGDLIDNTLSFTSTGQVKLVVSQPGNVYWRPALSLTNTFMVFAGGTMTVAPTNVTADSPQAVKFSFRADGIGTWGAGSQMRLTVPAGWPQPQTNSSASAGYFSAVTVGAGGTLSFAGVEGSGPWEVIVNYAGGSTVAKGFDLTYTNLIVAGPEADYAFSTACKQFGMTFTNASMQPEIAVAVKTNQTIDFPGIASQLTTNKPTLSASASSGLPVTFSVLSGSASLVGSALSFTSTGMVRIVASQAGDGDWNPAPSITNSFMVFAGGTLTVAPTSLTAEIPQSLKFSFRADPIGTWGAGSQVRLIGPAGWPQPQTNSTASPGYLSAALVGSGGTISFAGIEGAGPWEVVINYAGGSGTSRGFDLTYTNLVVSGPESTYPFPSLCKQFGMTFTNASMAACAVTTIVKTNQTIQFQQIENQLVTNKVRLAATASSGLPVRLYILSGSASLSTDSNLTFTSTGLVSVVASQGGDQDWHPAVSITNTFRVFAGGTMVLTPESAATATATNVLKFSFRGDGIADWQAGSLILITIPEGWSPPQTNSSTTPGFMKTTPVNATTVSIGSIDGTGPWTLTINYQGAKETKRGFDLIYTNATTPATGGAVVFSTLCRQAGLDFVNPDLNQEIVLIGSQAQSIDFPALNSQITTNKVVLKATATSDLPVSYAVSGPCTVTSGSNLTFTTTGIVSVVASQAGNLDWSPAPSVTNQFQVFAGGTLELTPAIARAGSTTNWLKFSFRGDDIAPWQPGSRIRLSVPADWTPPQTNSASAPGFVTVTLVQSTIVSIESITGTGPWDVHVNYSGAKEDTRGFELAYTNLTMPAAGDHTFETDCQQFGITFTNAALTRTFTLVEGAGQTVAFDALEDQIATNTIGLQATASSGLPVVFSVQSGPAELASGTNLSFTGTGTVLVAATQSGALYWNPASTSSCFTVMPAILIPTATVKTKTYNGTTDGIINAITLPGKLSADTVTASATAATFENRNAGTGKVVTVSGISLGGSAAARYELGATAVSAAADILPRAVMVQATADSKIYDGTPSSTGAPLITSGSLVAGDAAEWIQRFDSKQVGIDKTLISTGSVNDGYGGTNYSLTFIPLIGGTITAKGLTVSGASVMDKEYDGSAAAAITGGVLPDRCSGDDVELDSTTGLFSQSEAGEHIPVTAGLTLKGQDAANYTLLQPDGLFGAIYLLAPPVISGVETVRNGGSVCGFKLHWKGAPASSYTVEYSDTLAPGSWAELPGCIQLAGNSGAMSAVDTNNLPPVRFYRLRMTH